MPCRFAFYCRGRKDTAQSVSDCLESPDYRCFTSWDSNWTLNAVMVKKSTIMGRRYDVGEGKKMSIAEIGLAQHKNQVCEHQKSAGLA